MIGSRHPAGVVADLSMSTYGGVGVCDVKDPNDPALLVSPDKTVR